MWGEVFAKSAESIKESEKEVADFFSSANLPLSSDSVHSSLADFLLNNKGSGNKNDIPQVQADNDKNSYESELMLPAVNNSLSSDKNTWVVRKRPRKLFNYQIHYDYSYRFDFGARSKIRSNRSSK